MASSSTSSNQVTLSVHSDELLSIINSDPGSTDYRGHKITRKESQDDSWICPSTLDINEIERLRHERKFKNQAKAAKASDACSSSKTTVPPSPVVERVQSYINARVRDIEKKDEGIKKPHPRHASTLIPSSFSDSECSSHTVSSSSSQKLSKSTPPEPPMRHACSSQERFVRPPSPDAYVDPSQVDSWFNDWLPDTDVAWELLYDTCSGFWRCVVDEKLPFKPHRYLVVAWLLLAEVGRKKLGELVEDSEKYAKTQAIDQEFFENISAMASSWRCPEVFKCPRKYFRTVRSYLFTALDHAQNKGVYSPEAKAILDEANSISFKFFTEVKIHGYLDKLILRILNIHSPDVVRDILSPSLGFAQKFERAYQAIFPRLSPIGHQEINKLFKMSPSFHPLGHTNMWWQTERQVWRHSSGTTQEIRYIRGPVPVSPGIKPDRVFIGALEHMRGTKQRLSWFCNLDTRYINLQTREVSTPGWLEIGDKWLKGWEAKWVKMLLELVDDYEDVVDFFIIPQDGPWIDGELAANDSWDPETFKTFLIEKLVGKNGKGRFPERFHEGKDIKVVLKEIMDRVHKHYFPQVASSSSSSSPAAKEVWGKHAKMAFWGIFCAELQQDAMLNLGNGIAYTHCTDGVDRQTISMLPRQLLALMHLDRYKDPKMHRRVLGHALGPAAAVWKRAVHHKRIPFMLATANHVETLKGIEKKTIGDFSLVDVDIGEYDEQALEPGPAQAPDDEVYQRILKNDQEHSEIIPSAVPMTQLKSSLEKVGGSESKALEKFLEYSIKKSQVFWNGQPVKVNSLKDYLSLLEAQKVPKELQQRILFLSTQKALDHVIERLAARYTRVDLGYSVDKRVVSNEFIHRLSFVDRQGQKTLEIFRDVLLLKEDRHIQAVIREGRHIQAVIREGRHIQAVIRACLKVDLNKPKEIPAYTWEVRPVKSSQPN